MGTPRCITCPEEWALSDVCCSGAITRPRSSGAPRTSFSPSRRDASVVLPAQQLHLFCLVLLPQWTLPHFRSPSTAHCCSYKVRIDRPTRPTHRLTGGELSPAATRREWSTSSSSLSLFIVSLVGPLCHSCHALLLPPANILPPLLCSRATVGVVTRFKPRDGETRRHRETTCLFAELCCLLALLLGF